MTNPLILKSRKLLMPEIDEEVSFWEDDSVSKRDLWVWSCMGLVTVADVVKTICSQTSDHGGNVSNLVGNVGQLELAATAALGIYQTMRNTQSAWTMWALALSAVAGVVAACESLGDFGFGSPDRGTGFSAGATSLGFVVSELDGADPQDSLWSGDAANQYKARNKDQKDLLNRLADLDRAMVTIVQRQAGQAEQVRQGMAGTKTVLATGAAVCAGMAAFAAADPTKAADMRLLKMVGIFGALPMMTCAGLAVTGIVQGAQNGADAQGVTVGYDTVADEASARAAASPLPPLPAPAPVTPAVPVTPASPSAPVFGPVPAADSAPALAADPAPGAPAPAAAGASSTLGQVGTAVGMALQMEPALAQAAAQGMQSVQQFAQMPAQARRSDRPAPEPGGLGEGDSPAEPDVSGVPAEGPEPAAAASGALTGAPPNVQAPDETGGTRRRT